jgi:hypothetical protein
MNQQRLLIVLVLVLVGMVPGLAAASGAPVIGGGTLAGAVDVSATNPLLARALASGGYAAGIAPEYVQQARNIPTLGGLEVLLFPQGDVRAGGVDSVVVDIAQARDQITSARQVEVRVKAKPYLRVDRATAPGWSCRIDDGEAVCRRSRIADAEGGPNILLRLQGARSMPVGTQPITARLTWLEPDRRGRLVATRDVSRVRIGTAPALGVRVARKGALRQPSTGVAGQSQVVLDGRVTGIAGAQVETTWRQLCTTAAEVRADAGCAGKVAPRATFLRPVRDSEATAHQSMTVALPAITSATTLRFAFTARDEDDVVTATTTVIATPQRVLLADPRLERLDRAVAEMTAVQRGDLVGDRLPVLASRVISSAGTGAIRSDRDVTLRVRVPGRRITGVRWSVVAGPQALLRGARVTGGALTLRASRALAGETAVVLGRATLADGDTVDATTLIRIAGTASGPRTRTRDARLLGDAAVMRARGAETARAADALLADKLGGRMLARNVRAATARERLCDYWALVGAGRQQPLPTDPAAPGTPDAVLGDGASIWLGPEATATAAPCGEASTITFARGEIIFGETRFTNVRGEITRTGLRITGGTYRPPDEWLDLLPGLKETILQGTTFTVPQGLGMTAPFTKSGSWSALGGEFRLTTGLEMLELPKGWRFQPARLRLDTTGLILAELSAQAPGGAAEGEGSLSIAYGPLGQLELAASVANLGVLRQSDGSQVSLSGQGTLSITWKDNPDSETEDSGLSLVIDPEISIEAKGPIRLMENFEIQELALKWNPAKIEAAGKVRIGSQERDSYLDLSLRGAYAGADDWSFGLDADGAWKPGAGMTVSRLKGEVERSGTMTTVSVAGVAAGWTPTPALTVESLSADVTNRCPADTSPADCDPGEVRLELDVKGQLRLPIEGSTPTPWSSTARFNLKTLKFTIAGSIEDGQIGPKELNLRSIQINISNEQDAGFCEPVSKPERPSDGVRFGLVATGTVLGQNVSFTGQFGGDVGLCLLGEMRKMDPDASFAANFSAVTVGYASQDVTIARANSPPMQLKARQVRLSAQFKLPDVAKQIGVEGTGQFEGALAGRGFSATVSFALANRPVLFGDAAGSNLRMDGVRFTFDWNGPEGTRFLAAAELSYLTVASPAASTVASETPLAASIALSSAGAVISAGVDTARAPGGEVNGAFGVPDLRIRALEASVGIGASPYFSLNADVTLPERWSTPIGITAGSQVRLGASVSQTNPCFDFAIRRPANETTPTTGQRMAVDLGGKGLLAAHAMELTLAPTGCTVGSRQISPGFAVDFDGQIGGSIPVPVKVQAALTLPTPQQPTNFKLKTNVEVGAFSIGGAVAFEQTVLQLDIDVPANTYYLKLQGGINILGSVSSVDAEFRSSGLGNIYLRADVAAKIGLSAMNFDGRLLLELDVKAYKVQTARLNGRLNFKVLGTTLLGADAAFEYTEGRVTLFRIGVEAGINLGFASASGRVDVDYRLLKEPETAKDYTHRSFKVGFGGSFRIFFIRKSFSLSIVDSKVPISRSSDPASQNVDWTDSDEQSQPVKPADPEIRWPMVIGRDGSPIAFGRVTAITYRTAYAVDSAAGAPARGSASGGLDVRVCQSYPTAGQRCAAERVLHGVVYFQKQEIELIDGSIDFTDPTIAAACKGAASTLACSGRPYVLRGADWTHAVRLIERARAEYRAANAGQELPPVKAWSADRVPEALGAFGGPHNRKDSRARWAFSGGVQGDIPRTNGPGERYFGQEYGRATDTYDLVRQAPERAVPLAGDWDGDGIDNLAVWYSPLRSGIEGRWDFRRSDGTTFTVRRGPCETEFCGAIEPLGTTQAASIPADVQNGSKGAYWPIAGDWNGSTVDGMTVDDIGRVALLADGRLKWELWPQGEPRRIFRLRPGFGLQSDGVVDRPVVGDWNADGVTDIGVYRGPAARGGRGTWFLWLSTTIAKTVSGWDVQAPDFTIAFGSYGDLPVVGDWDNSGGDGIGVVAPQASNNFYNPRQWTLRFDADASCGENCASDLSPFFGFNQQYPIVGRWGP